jgi:hypothetical protein
MEVLRVGMLMDWSGVRPDACVPKHPACRTALSCLADRGWRPESATPQRLKFAHDTLRNFALTEF